MSYEPVNYHLQDGTAKPIERAVEHAIRTADSYLQGLAAVLPGTSVEEALVERCVLEVGPGPSLGAAVLLACHGARVAVVDRYPPRWQPSFHGAFYRALLLRIRLSGRAVDPDPIWKLLLGRAFLPEVVEILPRGIEDVEGQESRFDFVFSTDTLEHVGDLPRGLAGLFRMTRSGGRAVHQIDFRDHRDFSRPLEFLAMEGAAFDGMFAECFGECGNRVHPAGLLAELERAGFQVLRFSPSLLAEDTYLDDLVPRLHPDFRPSGREGLRVLRGQVVCEKPVSEASGTREPHATESRYSGFLDESRSHWRLIESREGRKLWLLRLWDRMALVTRIERVWNRMCAEWKGIRHGGGARLASRVKERLAGRHRRGTG